MTPDFITASKDRGDRLLRIAIPIELTNSNEGRTKHFGLTAKRRREYEGLLGMLPEFVRTPFDDPTFVVVTRVLGKGQRQWDCSSILRGNWKELEDSLVALGWWWDDSPKWITGVYGNQDSSRREIGPITEVEVWNAW